MTLSPETLLATARLQIELLKSELDSMTQRLGLVNGQVAAEKAVSAQLTADLQREREAHGRTRKRLDDVQSGERARDTSKQDAVPSFFGGERAA